MKEEAGETCAKRVSMSSYVLRPIQASFASVLSISDDEPASLVLDGLCKHWLKEASGPFGVRPIKGYR